MKPTSALATTRTTPSPDGVSIRYEVHGAGPVTLVFVHGWSCNRSCWSGQLESLARDYQVVAVDLAGHGASGRERRHWTIPAFGADVAAVVREIGADRSILIGHSMGGDVILEAARQLAKGVAGLIWVDVYSRLDAWRTPDQVQERMKPFRQNFPEATQAFVRRMFPAGSDPALVQRVADDMAAAPPEVALGALEAVWLFGPKVPGLLDELGIPATAINPDDQPTDLGSMGRHGVEVVVTPGVGHFLMMEDPGRFNRLLREVIERMLTSNRTR